MTPQTTERSLKIISGRQTLVVTEVADAYFVCVSGTPLRRFELSKFKRWLRQTLADLLVQNKRVEFAGDRLPWAMHFEPLAGDAWAARATKPPKAGLQ